MSNLPRISWDTWRVNGKKSWRVQLYADGKPVWYPPREAYSESDALAFIEEWKKQHNDTLARNPSQ